MVFEIPGVDVKKGLDFCDGDLDIYIRVLRSYVIDTEEALKKIQNVSEINLREYAVSVHGIKGTSEAIGAEETRETAKQLEYMAKQGVIYIELGKSCDMASILEKNKPFVKHVENLVNGIKNWLEKYGS